MRKKAILFDFDGTLANTIPGILATCQATKDKMKVDFSIDEAKDLIGCPLVEMGKILVGEERADTFVTTYLALFPDVGSSSVTFFEGVPEMLNRLREKGLLIAVVSSKRLSSLKDNLDHLDGYQFFDALITNDATIHHKPHPEPVEFALNKLGVEAKEAIMVGDTDFDILAGKGGYVETIGVTWGGSSPEKLAEVQPTAIANTLEELEQHILALL